MFQNWSSFNNAAAILIFAAIRVGGAFWPYLVKKNVQPFARWLYSLQLRLDCPYRQRFVTKIDNMPKFRL